MTARVALAGATGRMGEALIAALAQAADLELTQAFCAGVDDRVGRPVAPGSSIVFAAADATGLERVDVVIDFSAPAASLALLARCRAQGVPAVVGTTGFDAHARTSIASLAQHIAIVLAPNMSVGVNLSMALLALAARTLPVEYDVEIVEFHHRNKVDAPSGTALQMGDVIARARGSNLEALRLDANAGHTGVRKPGGIGFAALRGGDVIGEHTTVFAGDGERIEITHRSSSRSAYADGALTAARYVLKTSPGLYGMHDVLGLPAL